MLSSDVLVVVCRVLYVVWLGESSLHGKIRASVGEREEAA